MTCTKSISYWENFASKVSVHIILCSSIITFIITFKAFNNEYTYTFIHNVIFISNEQFQGFFTIRFFFNKQCFLSIYIIYFKCFFVFAKVIMVIVFLVYLSPYKKYARLVYLALFIWSLSERNGNRTHTHLISGFIFPVFGVNTKKYGIEKTPYFRHFSRSANVPAKTRSWYDKNIKSNALYK